MMEWPKRRLSEITSKIGSGATPRGGKNIYQKEGISFIRSQNVHDLRFDPTGLAYISDEAAESLKNVSVATGDVLINITGESVTRTCLVDSRILPARVSQHVAIIRPLAKELNSGFLLYSLLNAPVKAVLNTLSEAGATRRALTKGNLQALELSLPPLEEQERIAGVLGAFDDLIETNRRLAVDLENLALTMAESSQGIVRLHSISSDHRLRLIKPEGMVDHYSIPAFDDSLLPSRENGSSILSGKQILEMDSVLVSRLNPATERTWMAYPRASVLAACSPEFVVLRGKDGVPAEAIWALTATGGFWEQMRGSAGGTTNSRQRVDKSAIPNFKVPDVRELGAKALEGIANLVRGAFDLRGEAQDLARQRDELLPLLMSGRVRVRDLEVEV